MEENVLTNPVMFKDETIDKAREFAALSSEDRESKKHEISLFLIDVKYEYKSINLNLKNEIASNLVEMKKKYQDQLVEIDNQLNNDMNSLATDMDANEHDNAVKGLQTVAKRSKRKAKNDYFQEIKDEKYREYLLHDQYCQILRELKGNEGVSEKLKSSFLEGKANFNLVSILTNKKTWINLVPLFMLIVIIVAYYIGAGVNNYKGNLGDIINNGIFVAVVATGAVFIYSQGGFDMSLGNASLMCATIAALMYNSTKNIFLSLVIAIILGVFLGIVNAVLATMLNLPVMVMTLTMMNILAAVHEAILEPLGGLVNVASGMVKNPWVFAVYLVGFFILCWFVFNYTKVGRRNKYIGANKQSAKFNGINLMTQGIISFGIAGIGLGLCGFLFASSKTGVMYGSDTVLGQVGLNVVIAIVFGGMTTSGGHKSKVSCAIIGAFFSVFLDAFFSAISTPAFKVGDFCYLVKGIIFIVVSLANMWDTRGKMLAAGGSIQ